MHNPYQNHVKRDVPADVEWDAGDKGCGEILMELRIRLLALAPGWVLKLIARDRVRRKTCRHGAG